MPFVLGRDHSGRHRARLIEGGLPTEGAIAQVLVSKFADHLSFYRQSQILARSGIQVDRSTLADWAGTAAFHLGPVVDRLTEYLKGSTKLFMDETTAPVLDPGIGRTKTGYLSALACDDYSATIWMRLYVAVTVSS